MPPGASKPEPRCKDWFEIVRPEGKAQLDKEGGGIRGAESKSCGVLRLDGKAGVTYRTHVIKEVETKSDMTDRFAAVQVEIVFDFRFTESILHRGINHPISAGRRDIELIPTSQCGCISERESLEQRGISGDLSGLKGQE